MAHNNNNNNRVVPISGKLLLERIRDRGWSVERFALEAEMSTGTISRVLKGSQQVYWKTAEAFREALDLGSIEQLIEQRSDSVTEPVRRINEWLLDPVPSPWITASNQLQFRIWKLRHEHLPKSARGKFYDLESMSSEERDRCSAALLRHPLVCTKIGSHPHIIRNISTCEGKDPKGWWVIDEWVEGVSLREHLTHGPLPQIEAVRMGIEIARALQTLHANGIVRRELTPQSLLVEQESRRIIVTEFELAKLLDGSPTVSTDEWQVDPYRAPDAESPDVDARADIYSWARVMLELLCGTLPEVGSEKAALKSSGLPQHVVRLLGRCVSISRRSRPKAFDTVLDELREWSVCHE